MASSITSTLGSAPSPATAATVSSRSERPTSSCSSESWTSPRDPSPLFGDGLPFPLDLDHGALRPEPAQQDEDPDARSRRRHDEQAQSPGQAAGRPPGRGAQQVEVVGRPRSELERGRLEVVPLGRRTRDPANPGGRELTPVGQAGNGPLGEWTRKTIPSDCNASRFPLGAVDVGHEHAVQGHQVGVPPAL